MVLAFGITVLRFDEHTRAEDQRSDEHGRHFRPGSMRRFGWFDSAVFHRDERSDLVVSADSAAGVVVGSASGSGFSVMQPRCQRAPERTLSALSPPLHRRALHHHRGNLYEP